MEKYELPDDFVVPKVNVVDQPGVNEPDEVKAKTVPEPTGWRIMCVVPEVKDTFDGTGIIKSHDIMHAEQQTSHVLFVLKLGPDAYKDKKKFPSGPWCKEGDFVIARAYAGTRFKVFGREFRLLPDDGIDAVIEDPRGVGRAT